MSSESSTVFARKRNLRPKLFIINGRDVREYYLEGRQTMGRQSADNNPDINIPTGTVSRRHGMFVTAGGQTIYQDTGSSNGTFTDGGVLQPGKSTVLSNGNVLRIRARNAVGHDKDVVLVYSSEYPERSSWREVSLRGDIRSLEIGRGEGIYLQDETASRQHATFFLARNGWAIIDNNSKNGVFLNGKRIGEPVLLRPMDVVTIANHIFVFRGNSLLIQADETVMATPNRKNLPEAEEAMPSDQSGSWFQQAGRVGSAVPGQQNPQRVDGRNPAASSGNYNPGSFVGAGGDGRNSGAKPGMYSGKPDQRGQGAGGMSPGGSYPGRDSRYSSDPRINGRGKMLSIHIVERNVWNRLRKKTLLRNINMRIDSGSLVLILGGSGAGKTTFMNAVMGYEPAKGSIAYGNSDIYREYEKMKYEIGYVPQQDLLRMEDVVYDTLDNAAHMRLPESISPAEREYRVMNALNMFGLSREKDSLVGKLSGGQRKRLSIAVEYIGNPSLFFLDEPDSGLDGIMARELMVNLRQIANQGKIVMVISHSPDRAIDLFDKVIVLAKSARDDSGHLVYYGAPQEACIFFDTDSLEGIIGRVNRRDEGGQGLADAYIKKYESMRR